MNTLLEVVVSIVEHENLFEANSFSETWKKKILCFDHMINQPCILPEMRMRFFARTHKIVFAKGQDISHLSIYLVLLIPAYGIGKLQIWYPKMATTCVQIRP